MKEKKSSNKKIILIIILILLITLTCLLTFIKYFSNTTTPTTPNEPSTTEEKTYYSYVDLNNLENVEIIDQNKYNTSKKVKEVHEYEKYKFSNMKIYTQNNRCHLEFSITNLNNTYDTQNNIFIKFTDKENNIIHFMEYSLPELNVGETTTETIEITIDVSNAYDYYVYGL